MTDINAALSMDHLQDESEEPSEQELQAMLETAEEQAKKPPAAAGSGVNPADPRLKPIYPFTMEFVLPTGERLEGEFVNHVRAMKDYQRQGFLEVQLARGHAVDLLPYSVRSYNETVAHLMVSLKKRPKWFTNLQDLRYPEILQGVYKEVLDHERIFRGLPDDSE